MQYSSPPHQHDPGLTSAGWPPCHVRFSPCGHDADIDEDIKETLWGNNLTKIPTTAKIVKVAIMARVFTALPPVGPAGLCLLNVLLVVILLAFDVMGRAWLVGR